MSAARFGATAAEVAKVTGESLEVTLTMLHRGRALGLYEVCGFENGAPLYMATDRAAEIARDGSYEIVDDPGEDRAS